MTPGTGLGTVLDNKFMTLGTGLGTVLGQQVYDTWYWVRYSIGTTSL